MAGNTVVITLQANNQAAPVVSQLANQIESRLGGAIQKAAINSTLLVKGLEVGLGAVTSVIGRLTDGLKGAVKAQTETITVAGNIMKLTGLNFQQATDFVDQFSERISKVASVLPGTTSDYVDFGKAIVDDVIPAIREVNGAINPEKLQKELEAISTYGTQLSQNASKSSAEGAQALSKFLGGTATKAELMGNDFFQKNNTFRTALFAEVDKLGGDIRKLTVQQRLEIFKKAAQIPDEVLKAQSNSIAGLTSSFVSNLFDPLTGLFGFSRDLNKTATGSQSALSAFNDSLLLLIGQDGLLSTIGKLLEALGVQAIDPMLALRTTIISFNDKIRNLQDFLSLILDGFDAGFGVDTGAILKYLNLDNIGTRIGAFVNSIFTQAAGMDWSAVFGAIGVGLALVINEGLRFFNALDFGAILKATVSLAGGLFIGIGKFLSTLDWEQVLSGFVKLLGIAILASVTAAAAALVAPVIASIGLLGAGIAIAITGLLAVVVANWKSLTSAVSNKWNEVTTAVTGFFNNVATWFNDLISKIPGVGGKAETARTGIIPNFANGNPGLLSGLVREAQQSPPGSTPVIANSSEAILTLGQQRALMANRGGFSVGSLNIYTAATNAQEIAENVMNYLELEYARYTQSRTVTVEA
ncbi:hypothetical protein ACX27_26705 [Nostoc piscinale CENA21]|uniref:Uncharacterized protein n=1 Tax=Nostoc piscinale CENA21 TaxID=224013 RepID=A0A0M4TXV9_9NOSO|nr:hypothetical protein [Nostoc piscinale]ALF55619.1 hypothetical protein ACX27_26705 [Nostoc piscinale CENA21]